MSAPLNLRAALRTAGWPVGIVALSVIGGVAGAQLVTGLVQPTYEARASSVVAAYALDNSTPTVTAPPASPAKPTRGTSTRGSGKSTPATSTPADTGDTPTQQRTKPPVYQPNLSRSMVATVAQYAESTTVAAATADSLGLPLSDVLGHVDASFEEGNQIVTLTAKAPTAEGAMHLANTTVDILRTQVSGGGSLARKGTLYAQPLERAVLPTAPTTPNPLINGLLGGVLGLLLGLGLASLHRRFDDRLRTTEQITDELGLPILATVPRVGRNLVRRGARSAFRRRPVARAIRTATAALTPLTDLAGRRLMVTSAFQDDGKTFVAGLLSLGLAEQRYHVTLVEGQLRHPGLTRHFPSSAEHTVQRMIGTSEEDIASSAQVALRVIAAEPTDPEVSRALVRSPGFIQLLDNAAAHSDVLVINGPGVLASGDIAPLCSQADAAVLVIRAGTTKAPDARRALQVLRRLTIPIAGIIVTDAIDGGAGHRSPAETPLDVPWPTQSMQPALMPALTQHRVEGGADRAEARPMRGGTREYAMAEATFTPEPEPEAATFTPEPSFARAEPAFVSEPEPATTPAPTFTRAEPAYVSEPEPATTPAPTFTRAEPASTPAPEPVSRAPEPVSRTPDPQPVSTPPASHTRAEPTIAPEPSYPSYPRPEPTSYPPEPTYRTPEPAYTRPEPTYRTAEPTYETGESEPAFTPPRMYTDAEPTFAPDPEPAYPSNPEPPAMVRTESPDRSHSGTPDDSESGPDTPTRINEITGAETASHR